MHKAIMGIFKSSARPWDIESRSRFQDEILGDDTEKRFQTDY